MSIEATHAMISVKPNKMLIVLKHIIHGIARQALARCELLHVQELSLYIQRNEAAKHKDDAKHFLNVVKEFGTTVFLSLNRSQLINFHPHSGEKLLPAMLHTKSSRLHCLQSACRLNSNLFRIQS